MSSAERDRLDRWRVDELLDAQPGLRLLPLSENNVLRLHGVLAFDAQAPGHERIEDEYQVDIAVTKRFPRAIPLVRETAGRIPPSYHTLDSGALCLGAPARLRVQLQAAPTLPGFIERCVIPYLYGFSVHERTGGSSPFGELAHGPEGIRDDFASQFGVPRRAVDGYLMCASVRKRVANKYPCPCGSGKRVGRCHSNKVDELRRVLTRQWCRVQHRWLTANTEPPLEREEHPKLRLQRQKGKELCD